MDEMTEDGEGRLCSGGWGWAGSVAILTELTMIIALT